MILAIDYDNTFSEYPYEFNSLRQMFQSKGHKVYIVTARDEKIYPIKDDISKFDGVIYTAGKAKAATFRADIWIDDNPVTLCCDFVPGEPSATPGKALHQGYKDNHILWNWEENKFVTYVANPWNPEDYIKDRINE